MAPYFNQEEYLNFEYLHQRQSFGPEHSQEFVELFVEKSLIIFHSMAGQDIPILQPS